MAEVKWIKITTTMFDDEKIDFIESLPEADAILIIWIKLLTLAGRCNAGGYILLTENIPYTEEMLAHKFRRPLNTVKLALETFNKLGMLAADEKGMHLPNWEKHQNIEGLEKIREQTRKRVAKYREKKALQEGNVTVTGNVTPSNATDKELDIDKDIKKESVKKKSPHKQKYAEFVYMTEEEYQNLVDKYGSENAKAMVHKLDNYKGANGKKYKSDYRAILSWVAGEIMGKKSIVQKNTNKYKPPNMANFGERAYSKEHYENLYENV